MHDVSRVPPRRGRGAKSLAIAAAAAEILEQIQPATVRAVCYRLFVAGLIPNMSKVSTDAISRILVRAREEGEIPWGSIVDETRRVEQIAQWSDPSALWHAAKIQYRKDYWHDQPAHLEIWSEKGTVRGTLNEVLDEFGVAFRVMHGYGSATAVQDISRSSMHITKPFIALYVGDWDPSGLHMSEVDLPRRIEKYAGDVSIQRIALTPEDVHSGLPSFDVDTKRGDPRHGWFQRTYGSRCWELDALSPVTLRERVESAILSYIDTDRWEHAIAVERVEQQSMGEFLDDWNSLLTGLGPI